MKAIQSNEFTNEELHGFAKSVVNTLRPLADGTFEKMICESLNQIFKKDSLPFEAVTRGHIRKKFTEKLKKAYEENKILKPDLDIVVFNIETKEIVTTISCKATFREILMQSISWKQYFISSNDDKIKYVKVFLVTAWETLEEEMRKRLAILDGVYVTNKNVKIGGKIKTFDSIFEDIKELVKNQDTN